MRGLGFRFGWWLGLCSCYNNDGVKRSVRGKLTDTLNIGLVWRLELGLGWVIVGLRWELAVEVWIPLGIFAGVFRITPYKKITFGRLPVGRGGCRGLEGYQEGGDGVSSSGTADVYQGVGVR